MRLLSFRKEKGHPFWAALKLPARQWKRPLPWGKREEAAGGVPGRTEEGLFRRVVRRVDQTLRRHTITLSMQDGVIRVVVFRGRKVVAWGTENPEEELFSGNDQNGAQDARLSDR